MAAEGRARGMELPLVERAAVATRKRRAAAGARATALRSPPTGRRARDNDDPIVYNIHRIGSHHAIAYARASLNHCRRRAQDRPRQQIPCRSSVAVLDAGGHLVAFKREDKSGILRFDIAFGKAWGALGMGLGSRTLAERAAKQPAVLHLARGGQRRPPGAESRRGADPRHRRRHHRRMRHFRRHRRQRRDLRHRRHRGGGPQRRSGQGTQPEARPRQSIDQSDCVSSGNSVAMAERVP